MWSDIANKPHTSHIQGSENIEVRKRTVTKSNFFTPYTLRDLCSVNES